MNRSYRAYGLTCRSDVCLPGFSLDAGDPHHRDIHLQVSVEPPEWVRRARQFPGTTFHHKPSKPNGDPTVTLTMLGQVQAYELSYGDGTAFVIDGNTTRVWGKYVEPLTIEDLSVYLRGPVLGFILRQRGSAALHASAVSVGGLGVVFCGPSESGKSTTAAALALRGSPVLCDDITALKEEDQRIVIEPGCPQVCLWPDAVSDLMGSPDALPTLTPTWEKCFLALDGHEAKFQNERQALGVIYLLAPTEVETDSPRIEGLSAGEGLLELVKNTYMNWVLNPRQRAAEFELLGNLVATTPIRTIVPNAKTMKIEDLCNLILEDVRCLVSTRDPSKFVPSL